MSYKFCMLGYSGHGLVVGEALLALGYRNIWYAEKTASSFNPLNFIYAGFEESPDFPWADFDRFALGVGDNDIRRKIAEKNLNRNNTLLTVIHPQALLAEKIVIGAGTFVARGACINPLAEIATGVIINTGAIIEHECFIASFAHVGPGAVLAGNVKVGEGAFVGANSVVRQGVKIGAFAVVGAGAVVIKDVPAKATVVGNPARILNIER